MASMIWIGLGALPLGDQKKLCTFLGSNCISWGAKKYSIVAWSSAEAEYWSMASTIAELLWLWFILCDLGIPLSHSPIIHCDNLNALQMIINPVFHGHTKHVELDYHFGRDSGSWCPWNMICPFQTPKQTYSQSLCPRFYFVNLRTKLGLILDPWPHLGGSESIEDISVANSTSATDIYNKYHMWCRFSSTLGNAQMKPSMTLAHDFWFNSYYPQ